MVESHYALLERFADLQHCVSRREPDRPLEGSLARHTGHEALSVDANRGQVERYFATSKHFVSALQVHGDHVAVMDRLVDRGWDRLDETFRADALVTDLPGVVLTILTADCVPILLYDPVQRAIGAVHAGWRGTQQEIVRKTIERMGEQYGTKPEDLITGIGPAIGGCCYEVGGEVAKHFIDYPEAWTDKGEGKYLLDTKRINARQLIELGVPEAQIEISPYCTSCDVDRFFSYRAEQGTAGRFMSCIMLDAV